ncbi:MAG TPA: SurA N-terminal domain-containing protein [Bacteroidia bacterium]|mgnify:CR=1 FL=1|nr:hypothetical protein [Sphingobacteriales bacterium]HPD65906.1 SurA N-terminal domain-containing protein [Bacteroidia bacterium]HRS59399.1 SurA N-terminal domain-containing protein [Bacteroidia bacterium]HRU68483.1 SurA N-terminal domain-containing protein [Bacteroidia bacterium]
MAAIGTIRKYSGIAVGAIFISILAFIISDAFQSNSIFFGRNKMVVGVIDGEKISYQEFLSRLDVEIDKHMKQTQSSSVDETTRDQLRERLWNKYQDEIIYNREYEALGLAFSSEELSYTVSGPNPHPAVQSFFTNPKTQQFDRNLLVNFLKNMDQYPEYKEIWLDFEEELAKETLKQKYFDLVKSGFYLTNLEAKDIYYAKNKFASFDYVMLPLRDVADSLVEPTDAEIEKYYKKHKEKYKTEESRTIDYVYFDVNPTKEDSLTLFNQLLQLREEFKNTKNDSLFVNVHSDEQFDTQYRKPGYYAKEFDNVFFTIDSKDTVIGPIFDKGFYRIAKLVDKKADSITYYRVSHILIKPKGATNQDTLDALKRARELMAEARTTDFSELAIRYSDDKGSAIRGGDLEWFKDGDMVKPFMEAVKRMKKGDMTVVKSEFGAHLIKCTNNPNTKVIRLAVVSKRIEPSPSTYQDIYAKAVKFRSKIKKVEDFENAAREMELNKMNAPEVRPVDRDIAGLPNAKVVVSWAYREKKGAISDVLDVENRYVVAALTEVYFKGTAPLEKVKEQVKQEVLKEKKQQYLLKKFEEVQKSANSIEDIAKALGRGVEKITNASFEMPFITGLGEEKLLMGYVFGSEKGKLSQPIPGENAVYQFVLKGFSDVQEPKDLSDIKKDKISSMQSMSQYTAMEALKELADIKDLRYKFF